uniref:Ig-like domain-containing protein n=1 Tax=Gadus morhua TaxID=8049 RepID=A0A8C5AC39_GADMO
MLVVLFTGFTVTDLSFLTYAGYQQTIHSIQDSPVQALQGDGVTLSCNYSSATYFFWYRQYPKPPQFLLYISGFGNNRTAESLGSDKRFSTELTEEKTGVDLKISSVAVTDSALYYCALQPTVTGNIGSLYKNLLSTKQSFNSP